MSRRERRLKKLKRERILRKTAGYVIILCLLAIAVYSGIQVSKAHKSYQEGHKIYKEVSEDADADKFDPSSVNFKSLKKTNPDIKAWINYEDTAINYPIVQGEDNQQYMYKAFNGDDNTCGTLFVDYITEKPFRQFNTIVYGHHMKDGSMFADIEKLKKESFAKEHPRFTLVTEDGAYDCNIWAFLNPEATDECYRTNFKEKDSKEKYIKHVKENAKYTIGEVTPDDKLVVLSTCAYEFEGARYVAIAKMTER